MVTIRRQSAAVCLLALGLHAWPAAAAPQLLALPQFQSPVTGVGNDVLLLAGAGLATSDRVRYRTIPGSGGGPVQTGELLPLAQSPVPDGLWVRLPGDLARQSTVALQVVSQSGHSSAELRINDPRPAWFSPARLHQSAGVADLPRTLRLVGRNLPSAATQTRLRLIGPADYSLRPGQYTSDVAIDFPLPARLATGRYSLALRIGSNDAIAVPGQTLEVLPDPGDRALFAPGDVEFGRCTPDDDRDDAGCLVRAIAAAAANGGGQVLLSPGRWQLGIGGTAARELVLPPGVDLIGAGAERTSLLIAPPMTTRSLHAALTLAGRNVVRGITFAETRRHEPSDPATAMLQLGLTLEPDAADSERTAATDIVVTGNRFAGAYRAIGDAGRSIERLYVTRNEFGAFETALSLTGNRFNTRNRFRLIDSVIAYNRFEPGGMLDVPNGRGSIASEIGGSLRLDFSSNDADGTSRRYLAPGGASGWRAGFFWHLQDSQENLLVSRNIATCSGDLLGDGEAIALDNNANTYAFPAAQPIVAATVASVSVSAPLLRMQNARPINPASYYVGHWLQVVAGVGRGQARRIVAYRTDERTGQTRFEVSPAWDIVPSGPEGRLMVGRTFWQAAVVANNVDHRSPPCRKSNRTGPRGGAITVWAQSLDSLVQDNVQHDTDGISFQQAYSVAGPDCPDCASESLLQWFLTIRGNEIHGEYERASDCSRSGIQASHGAAPSAGSNPPVLGYGVSVTGNLVDRADGITAAAISAPLTWHAGPRMGAPWTLIQGMVIQHNRILGQGDPPARVKCATTSMRRTPTRLAPGTVRNSIVDTNECDAGAPCAAY